MSSAPKFNSARMCLRIAFCAIILIVVYLLSLGPLFYLACAHYISASSFDDLRATVYRPAMYLSDHSDLYFRYIAWWIERGIDA